MSALLLARPTPRAAKYFFVARIGFKNGKIYPLELFLPSVVVVARLWVFTLVFEAAFRSKGVSEINHFTPAMAIWMNMFAQSFQQAAKGRVWQEISREVQSGNFATMITKPMSYGFFHFWRYAGNILPSLGMSLAVGAAAALVLVGPVAFAVPGLLALGITLTFGIILNFLIYFCCGLSALWLEDSTPVTWVVSKMIMIFGGLLIPVALLPDVARRVAELLPFAQIFALPAQLTVDFSAGAFFKVVAGQLFWLGVLLLLAAWAFKKGRRYVASNGG